LSIHFETGPLGQHRRFWVDADQWGDLTFDRFEGLMADADSEEERAAAIDRYTRPIGQRVAAIFEWELQNETKQ
jgi:hypothetical protein